MNQFVREAEDKPRDYARVGQGALDDMVGHTERDPLPGQADELITDHSRQDSI